MWKNAFGGTSNKNLKIIKMKQFNMAILMVYEQTPETEEKYLYKFYSIEELGNYQSDQKILSLTREL